MNTLISKGQSLFLILMNFVVLVNFTITFIASPYIIWSLGGSDDISSYMISFFAFGCVIGIPLSSLVMRHFKILSTYLVLSIAFATVTHLCCFSKNFFEILTLRLLQGFFCGLLIPMISCILGQVSRPENKAFNNHLSLLISVSAPALGASLGGIIAYEYDWRWLFYITPPLILFLSVPTFFILRKHQLYNNLKNFNCISYLFFCLWVLCIGSAITLGQFLDWQRSNTIIALTSVGIFSLIFYILWDFNHPSPILNLHLFKRLRFFIGILSLFILFSLYYGNVLLLSSWLTFDVKFDTSWVGIITGHIVIATFLLSIFAYKIHRFDPRIPLSVAILLFLISSFYTSTFSADIDFLRLAISRVLSGFSLALFLAPIQKMCLENVSSQEGNEGNLIFQMARNLAGGLGAAFFTTVWWRRSVFFHERLGEQLTSFSTLTKNYLKEYSFFHMQGKPATAELEHALNMQSKALALDDTFYLMSWIFVALLITLLLTTLKKKPFMET
ncbi:MAG: DHA2 family efflux MFS transporter permease subunit [Chlamydiae bacterium]|nr:DHA2 family efflux MFS transporter permease subunit [Chlamydiota bacterium]